MENQISIIINGTRYDAVEAEDKEHPCRSCALIICCDLYSTRVCVRHVNRGYCFVKSDEKFEV